MRERKQHLIYRHGGDKELKLAVPVTTENSKDSEQTVAEIIEKVCANLDWLEFHLAHNNAEVHELRREFGRAFCTVMLSEPDDEDETTATKSSLTITAEDAKSLITSLYRFWEIDKKHDVRKPKKRKPKKNNPPPRPGKMHIITRKFLFWLSRLS